MHEPAERHENEDTGVGGFVLGLVCGAALGAAVGLLFAPRSGSEFRQQISDSTEEFRRQAAEKYGQASKVVADIASRGRDALKRTSETEGSATGTESGGSGGAYRPS